MQIGYQIDRLENGLAPDDWKPMATVGSGGKEIRVHADNEYRTFYMLESGDEVYILHVFVKKTRKTSKKDIALGVERYKQAMQFVREKRKRA